MAFEDNELSTVEKQTILLSYFYPVIPKTPGAVEMAYKVLDGGLNGQDKEVHEEQLDYSRG